MEVRFTVDAYGRREFHGTVDAVRLNASTNNNVVTYPVWITVPNDDLTLRPSLTANLRIVISTANDVVRVPNQALRFRPNAEIYTALGLTPPAPGSGGRAAGAGIDDPNGAARNGAAAPGARPGGQGAGAQQNPQGGGQQAQQGGGQGQNRQGGGQTAQGGQRTPGGRGFGQGSDLANMTPEQRQAMMERFRAQGGRTGQTGGRGGNQGGRGGNQGQSGRTGGGRGAGQGQRGAQQGAAPQTPAADKIDELWAPVPRTQTRSQVYTWNEPAKELKMIPVVLGVSDGTFSELVSGDLKVGDQIVTGVILPLSQQKTMSPTANPFQQNQPGRMPGMTPGNPGGGNPGGGRGGGGGGGGRGGN
jgi:hypothetical protein